MKNLRFVSIIFIFCTLSSSAFARLQIYPLRVFLDQRERGSQVVVRNITNEPLSYKINTVYFEQDEQGRMTISENGDHDNDLSPMIRFSPRVVQLGPGESQTVRLMVRNLGQLPESDYRSHLRFEQTIGSFEAQNETEQEGMTTVQTSLRANIAVSIPIYLRIGNPSLNLSLSNLNIDLENERFSVEMTREGNAIPYGDFRLYQKIGNGEKEVARVSGVQSFISKRKFIFPISEIDKVDKSLENKQFTLKFIPTRKGEENFIASTEVSF